MAPLFSSRRRKVLLTAAALVGSGYATYRLYKSPVVAGRRKQLVRISKSISSLREALFQIVELVSIIFGDFKSFLLSDRDEVPRSLLQVFKIGQSPEFKESVVVLCAALTQGMLQGVKENNRANCKRVDSKGLGGMKAVVKGVALSPGKGKVEVGTESIPRSSCLDRAHMDIRELQLLENDYEVGAREKARTPEFNEVSRFKIQDQEKFEPDADELELEMKARLSGGNMNGLTGPVWMNKWKEKRDVMAANERTYREWQKDTHPAEGFSERFLEKLFTQSGTGFASVVVGSVARNLVCSLLLGLQDAKRGVLRKENILKDDAVGGAYTDANFRKTFSKKSLIEDSEIRSSPSSRNPQIELVTDGIDLRSASPVGHNGTLDVLCSERCRSLIIDCVQNFVSTAVSVYIDKTKDINIYNDMVEGIVSPAHQEPVKELITSVCKGAVETLVRTSHDIMSKKGFVEGDVSFSHQKQGMQIKKLNKADREPLHQSDKMPIRSIVECPCSLHNSIEETSMETGDHNISISHNDLETLTASPDHSPVSGSCKLCRNIDSVVSNSPGISVSDEGTSYASEEASALDAKASSSMVKNGNQNRQNWIEGVSRTLAIPSNRKLVLDVAGTMTSEAVRSFFEVLKSIASSYLGGRVGKEIGEEGKIQLQRRAGHIIFDARVELIVLVTICVVICLACTWHLYFYIQSKLISIV